MSLRKIESAEDWEPYLGEIRRLYLDEHQKLKSVRQHLETEHHVKVTYVQAVLLSLLYT